MPSGIEVGNLLKCRAPVGATVVVLNLALNEKALEGCTLRGAETEERLSHEQLRACGVRCGYGD